jgi:hypothetical protein
MSAPAFRYEVVLKSNILKVVAVYNDLDYLMENFEANFEAHPDRFAIIDNLRNRIFAIEFARATKEAV